MGILSDRMNDMEARIKKLKKRMTKLEDTLAGIAVIAGSEQQKSFKDIIAAAMR
jgi:hypothetical protein